MASQDLGSDADAATPKSAAPDGMIAYQMAMDHPDRNDPTWPLPSFDAKDWADEFCRIARDEVGLQHLAVEWMQAWFANALMRGWDEHARQTASSCELALAERLDSALTVLRLEGVCDDNCHTCAGDRALIAAARARAPDDGAGNCTASTTDAGRDPGTTQKDAS